MGDNIYDYIMTYSYNKLEETARTFRRLGEAYNSASDGPSVAPGISRQLFLVADTLEECMTIQSANINISVKSADKNFIKELKGKCIINGIRIKNTRLITGSNGKHQIILMARSVGRGCISIRRLLSVIACCSNTGYYSDNMNRTIINEEFHQYVFVEEDRFRILSGVSRINKGKERYNGDNFLMSHPDCGKAIAAIADGMGCGKRAFIESRMVIELIENCIKAGFDEKAALELVNSAYIAGGGMGNPVTVDMSIIDCQTAYMHCIKLGAVSTFIKRESCVEIIKSTTLPIGVLEKVDYDCTTKKLYDGDYVVMVSDGILDNFPCINKEEQMADVISSISVREPNAMAAHILKQSLRCHNNKPSDDCTVMVIGLFDTYRK